MESPSGVQVAVRGDCGHEFMVPIAGLELGSMEFTCPICGAVDRFSPDQAKEIAKRFEASAPEFIEQARKAIRDLLKK